MCAHIWHAAPTVLSDVMTSLLHPIALHVWVSVCFAGRHSQSRMWVEPTTQKSYCDARRVFEEQPLLRNWRQPVTARFLQQVATLCAADHI